MWLPPPPVTDRWVLHIAAPPRHVDTVLHDLGIDEHARPIGDPDFPAYLTGRDRPHEPPPWLSQARAELNRRGHRTRWCTPGCPHHSWPPRPAAPDAATAIDGPSPHRRRTPRPSGAPGRPRSTRRLTAGATIHARTGPQLPARS
jgi:hypothetical protein